MPWSRKTLKNILQHQELFFFQSISLPEVILLSVGRYAQLRAPPPAPSLRSLCSMSFPHKNLSAVFNFSETLMFSYPWFMCRLLLEQSRGLLPGRVVR